MKIVTNINFLRQKSLPVGSVAEAEEILKKLDSVLSIYKNGVGLGAIQIGIPKTVALIKWKDKSLALINPEVLEKEDEIIYVNEGCLSFPNIYRDTKRYSSFIFKNQKIIDNEFYEETQYLYYSSDLTEPGNDGIISIAAQHEIDHFDGKLLIDYEPQKKNQIMVCKKVGRNDLCPCGSGKKFKKCCMGIGKFD